MLVLSVLMVLEDDVDFPDVKPTLDTPSNFKNRLAVGGTKKDIKLIINTSLRLVRKLRSLKAYNENTYAPKREDHFYLLIQMAILSPLPLILTTAPLTSCPWCSPKASPISKRSTSIQKLSR